ncbi:MAG: geranylgeranyl reductase family protein [Actinomycetota bacterium]
MVVREVDVIIAGGGPGGSTAAYHLAVRGKRVLVIEKSAFPREKVCGDGLTPRAVKALHHLGLDTTGPEWARSEGLRIIGAGHTLELPWPELNGWPGYALVRARLDLDELLLRHAEKAGATVWTETEVVDPILDPDGVVIGVRCRSVQSPDDDQPSLFDGHAKRGRVRGEILEVRAPVVIAADGVANRFGQALGIRRIEKRPMGVAVRTYFRSPRASDNYLESYLELWRGDDLLPGYGWIFPTPDGTVNIGLGLLNSSAHFQQVDYRGLLTDWVANLPPDWELDRDNQVGQIRGAGLPMGFNRTALAKPGLMLIGDAAGAVNPFNGEGIAYAMETGELAAGAAIEALASGSPHALRVYPDRLKETYEGYFILGRAFVRLIGEPKVMRFLTQHGLKRRDLMRFAFKVLANLAEPRRGDSHDRLFNAMVKVAPTINKVVGI